MKFEPLYAVGFFFVKQKFFCVKNNGLISKLLIEIQKNML